MFRYPNIVIIVNIIVIITIIIVERVLCKSISAQYVYEQTHDFLLRKYGKNKDMFKNLWRGIYQNVTKM
jgi:hypothetical protein